MSTILIDGPGLQTRIKKTFGSIDRMISQSEGLLKPSCRSGIYRATENLPIETSIAEVIACLLSVRLPELMSAGGGQTLRLSEEGAAFYEALRILGHHLPSGQNFVANQCIYHWLKTRLDVSPSIFSLVMNELVRVQLLEHCVDGTWKKSSPTIYDITRRLKHRVGFQWPIVREVFSDTWTQRKRTSRQLRELLRLAESKLADPISFFSIDDEIHTCLCSDPHHVEMVQASRAVSWNIAHFIIEDITSQMHDHPQDAIRSMKTIASWMLEDYAEWSVRLERAEIIEPALIQRSFRRHVLRMRDYAQYYYRV